MEELESGKIKITNDLGEELVCDVLFTFDSDETNKSYIVYTDNTLDENRNIKVYASIFDPNDDNTKLEPIETEKEWKIIENILETLQEEAKKDTNEGNKSE